MSNNTLIDNWSLQDIVNLVNRGLENSSATTINVDQGKDCFSYGEIPTSIIQTEAIFEFLNDIVLRDQLIVDEKYKSAWNEEHPQFDGMMNANIIRPFSFQGKQSDILDVRQLFEDNLCVTTDLKKAHSENIIGWNESNSSPHNYLAQVMWGGAGMSARCAVYELSYTPHPLRKRFFSSTGFYQSKFDALSRVNAFIEEKRAILKNARYGNREVNTLAISINPIVARIIRESSSASDLITNAISFRDDYAGLRNWIRAYQESAREPNQMDIAKREDLLRSISSYIDSKIGIGNNNPATFTVGFSVLKLTAKGNPINYLKNQFGVRSCISELISTEGWESDLLKYLGFFNERSSRLGIAIKEFFSRNMNSKIS